MSEDIINEKLFEKLRLCHNQNNIHADVIETLRSVTARLYSRTASQDKQIREKTLSQLRRKKDSVLQTLLTILEACSDRCAIASIAGIIHQCVCPKSGSGRFSMMRQLIDLNASQILMKSLLQQYSNDTHYSDCSLHELIWTLGQLSQKDGKFALKVRQLNAICVFHFYLKIYYQNKSKLLVPLLMIVKIIARNALLLPNLIKDGIASTMEKILIGSSLNPSMKLRLVLSAFMHLTKNEQFCNRVSKEGVVGMLLKIFSRCEKYDGKISVKICTDTIVTLQHICSTKAGRNAIRRENGFTSLYKFCLTCPEDKIYDRLLSKVCTVINVCLEKKELPISSTQSPLSFALPMPLAKDLSFGGNSDDSDDEDEDKDEVESDKDFTDTDLEKMEKSISNFISLDVPLKRSFNDLQISYRENFAEYFHHIYEVNENSENSIEKDESIINKNDLQEGKKSSLKILEDLDSSLSTSKSVYCKIASKVRSIGTFVKVAYPDMMGGAGVGLLQPFYVKDRKVSRTDQSLFATIEACSVGASVQRRALKRAALLRRSKLVTSVDQNVTGNRIYNNVVYDLDKLLCSMKFNENSRKRLSNNDETRLGMKESSASTLFFESRFESGNLRKAIQVGAREYDLILTADVNCNHHIQWFYFEVSNMDNGGLYTFNIINCEKSNSQFNYGMRPLLYSVRECTLGRVGWIRSGIDICYYRNSYRVPSANNHTYLTTAFTIKFPHALDVCYIAYTFPYTYSHLMHRIIGWKEKAEKSNIILRVDKLCDTLNNNEVAQLTITAPDTKDNKLNDREIVFLTSRVHPGEANSSWVIDGSISYILENSTAASKLRKQYVFKIIPMLNVEGVINGCHRCGLTGEDLNRKWNKPNPVLHPAIYHAKGLMEYCVRVLQRSPYLYCDFHGHSRRKNVFFYGCCNEESWLDADRAIPNVGIDYLLLPHLMENCSAAFASELCQYKVERSRESTARVTVWREFGVNRSYTIETSYCGSDVGPYKGYHFDTNHLQEIGYSFCMAMACLYDETKWRMEMILAKDDNRESIITIPIEQSSSSTSSLEFAEDSSDFEKENYYIGEFSD